MTDVAFHVSVTQDMVREAVIAHLRESKVFKKAIDDAVRAEVQIQGPGSPRIATVVREVQEHLDRYPSLANDVGLQGAVGKAIFDYMQKSL